MSSVLPAPLPRLKLALLLLGLVLAALIPALAASGAAVWNALGLRREAAEAGLRDTARALSLALDREINRHIGIGRGLAASHALDPRDPDLASFEAQARRVASTLGPSVALLEGTTLRQLVNTALPPGAPAGRLSAADFRAAVESRRVVVTDLVVGAVAGRPVIGIAVPVVREDRVPFVLAVRLDPDGLHRLLAAQNLPPGSFAGVTDSRGVVVARSDALHNQLLGQAIPTERVQRRTERGTGIFRDVALDGTEQVFGFDQIASAPGWTVVVAQPAALFDAAMRGSVIILMVGATGALGLGAALALLAARSILVPLRRLESHAQAIVRGAGPAGQTAAAIPPAAISELEALRRGFAEADRAIATHERALRESEARFRTLADNIPQLAWMAQPDGWIFWYNKRWFDFTGTTLQEMNGWGWRSVHHPEHLQRVEAGFRSAIEGGVPWDDTFPIRRRDGIYRWFLSRAMPVRDDDGRIALWFGTNTDITQQRDTETALAESEARLRLAGEAAGVGVFEVDLANDVTHWSPMMFSLYGLDPAKPPPSMNVGAEHLNHVHPDDREALRAARTKAVEGGDTGFAFDFRILRGDTAEVRWITSRGEFVRDSEGQVVLVRGAQQDITERRLAEERQTLLAREVDHRAKNVLAVVQSIVRLSDASDADLFADAIQGRVAALARAHTLLSREQWSGADLRETVEHEIAPYDDGGRVILDGPPVTLSPGAVQPVSMVVHELATNAAKHGALSTPAGRVGIAWRLEPSDADERLLMRWVEREGPVIAAVPTRQGFGSTLLEGVVRLQLGGEIRTQWEPEGLTCEFSISSELFHCGTTG